MISNLIVDQTSTNPAADRGGRHPGPHAGRRRLVPCTTEPIVDPITHASRPRRPADCTPPHKTLFIPNVTTDVGLSPPYNSLFTFFGQFFDHGVDQTVKSGGTVFVPLKADDPLRIARPGRHRRQRRRGAGPSRRFMVLTRAQNQPGPDGILGDNPATPVDESADDVQDATNTDTPWVDQSQTYTSHASHQVFLREYELNTHGRAGRTGKLLGGLAAGERRRLAGDGNGTAWRRGRRSSAGRDEARPQARPTRTSRTSRCSPPTRTATSSPARTGCRSRDGPTAS